MIKSKQKPLWYQLRWKLSNLLVWVARKVYPQNPETTAFYMETLTDQLIAGRAVVRVDPMEMMGEQIKEGNQTANDYMKDEFMRGKRFTKEEQEKIELRAKKAKLFNRIIDERRENGT